MKNKTRKIVAMALAILTMTVLLVIGGCMRTDDNAGNEPSASALPSGMETPMPTSGIGSDGNPGAVGTARYDWGTSAQQVEANVGRLSEVSECRVVVTGTTALVGVKYTSAYQGETTERIREMVAGVVREADPAIQTVAVTSQAEDVEEIYRISDEIRGGASPDDKAEDINRIVRNATTLR